jgi:protein-tyrosine phosphatase
VSTQGPKSKVTSDILANAKYVATNTSDWLWQDSSSLPNDKATSSDVGVARVIGGKLLVEEATRNVTKGHSYNYVSYYQSESGKLTEKTSASDNEYVPVHGLTAVSASPLLFGSMGPDQYILPSPIKLDEVTINNILAIFEEKRRDELRGKLEALEIKDAENHTLGRVLDLVSPLTREQTQKVYPQVQAFVGKQHVKMVANVVADSKQYAALSIAGKGQSEASGFIHFHKNDKNIQSHKTVEGNNSVAWYQGENDDPLLHHFVIQSKSDGVRVADAKEPIKGELNIAGSDFDQIVNFYEETMAKGIPVVVNCTDGIDRTGMLMTAMMILHQYNVGMNEGKDFTALSQTEQQMRILDIVESLKRDRGPAFIRSTHDVGIAVLMGYTLIATQKQKKLESELLAMNDLDPRIKSLIQANHEPDLLVRKIEEIIPTLDGNNLGSANQLLELVRNRSDANILFLNTNNHTSDLHNDFDNIDKHKAVGDDGSKSLPVKLSADGNPIKMTSGKVTYSPESAPFSVFVELIKEGVDPKMVLKDNKSMYHFATQALLKNTSLENLKQMAELIKNGKKPAMLAVEQTLIENKMDQRLIGMALQVLENKKSVKSIKSELSSIGTAERAQLLQQLENLSRFGDKDSKKIFKQLNDALPNKSKAKRNNIEMNARVTQPYTSSAPSSGQSEKAKEPRKDNETIVKTKGPMHSEQPQYNKNVVRQIISGWNYNYKGATKELSEAQKASMSKAELDAKPEDTKAVPLSDEDYSALAISVSYALSTKEVFEELAQMRMEIFKKPIPDNEKARKELQDEKDIFLYNTSKFIVELIKADPNQKTYAALNKYLVAREEDKASVLAEFQAKKVELDLIPADNQSDEQKNELNQIEILLGFRQIVEPQPTDLVEDKPGFDNLVNNTKTAAEYIIKTKEEKEKISQKFDEASLNDKAFNIDTYLHSTLSHKKVKTEDMKENAALVAQDLKNRQLMTLMDMDPNELTHQGWNKNGKERNSPHVLKLISELNNMSGMVAEDLLTAKSQVHQQNIFNFYVVLLDQCMQQRNYHTAMAIVAGFNASHISRLKYLNTDKKMNALLSSHVATLDPQGSFKNYRGLVAENKDEALVPYLGVSLSDLTFSEDGNPGTRPVVNPEGGIDVIQNVEKLTLIGKLIHNVTSVSQQSKNYTYLKKVEAEKPLQQTNIASRIRPSIDESLLFERSLKIYPRPVDGKTVQPFKDNPEVAGKKFREVESPVISSVDSPSDTAQPSIRKESDAVQSAVRRESDAVQSTVRRESEVVQPPAVRRESDATQSTVRRESDAVQPATKRETKSKIPGFSKLRELMLKKSEISPESPLQPTTTKSKSSNLPEQNISSPDTIAALKSAASIFSKYPSKENLDKMIGLQKTILSSRSSTQSMVDVLDELGMNIAPSISEEITKALKSELKNMGSKQRAAAHRLLKETAGDKSYKNDKNILRTMDKSLPSKKTSRKNDEIISKNDEVTRARLKKTYVDNVVAKLNKDYEDYKLNKLDPAQFQEFSRALAVYSNINDNPNSEIRAAAIAIRTEILNSRSEQKQSVKAQAELSSPPPSATLSSPLSDTPELEELKKQLIKGLTSITAATSEDKQIINYYISQFEDKINLSAVNKYVGELRDHLKYNTNHKDYRENKFLRSNHLQPIHQQVQNEIKKFKDAVVVAENKMKSPIVSAQSEDEKAWEGVEVDLDNPNQKLPSGVPIQTVPVIASAASHPQDHSLPSTPKGGRPPSVVFNHVHPDPVNVSTPSVRRQLPVPSAEQVVKAICAQLNANKQESALPVQWNGIIKRVEEHANNDGLSASEKLGEIKKYLEDNIVNSSRPVPPNIKSKITEMIQKLPIEAVLKAADDDKKTKLRK